MRIVRIQDRKFFSPPGSSAKVAILSGKMPEQGSFEKHTVAIVTLPAGSTLDQHFHKEREESYIVLSGSGAIVVNSKRTDLNPGDLVSVSPGEVHLLEASKTEALEYVVVTAPAWTIDDVHRVQPVQLRKATPNDEQLVNDLTKRVMSDYVRKTWPTQQEYDVYFKKNAFDLESTRIIQLDGKDVGRVSVLIKDGAFWIDNIHVSPDLQSRGVGSQVMTLVLKEASNARLPARLILLKVNPVKALYERLGFRVYEETKTHFFMEHPCEKSESP